MTTPRTTVEQLDDMLLERRTITDELLPPLADWTDPAAPAGTENGGEAHIVRSID
jgi:hypothetical protein